MTERMTYEQLLERDGQFAFTNRGVSMLPLLRQGKDLFIVRKKGPERCKKGDVVLYRRPPDQYVLHRVIAVRKKDYVILGDNCVNREYGITDEDILGVMTGFVRGRQKHTVEETGYRIYTFLMLHTIPVRVFAKKSLIFCKRGIRKLFPARRKT